MRNKRFIIVALVLAGLIGGGSILYGRAQVMGEVAVNGVAKSVCSCVFLTQHSLEVCRATEPAGFEIVNASLDPAAGRVETSVFWGLIKGEAQYDEALGCSLR